MASESEADKAQLSGANDFATSEEPAAHDVAVTPKEDTQSPPSEAAQSVDVMDQIKIEFDGKESTLSGDQVLSGTATVLDQLAKDEKVTPVRRGSGPSHSAADNRGLGNIKSPSSEPNMYKIDMPKDNPGIARSASDPGALRRSRRNIFSSFYIESTNSSFVHKTIDKLRRAASQLSVHETFYCQVCLDNVDVTEGYALAQCKHTFCRLCVKSYIASQVTDAITVIKCPCIEYNEHAGGVGGTLTPQEEIENARGKECPAEISEMDVRALLEPDMLAKYERFKLQASDKNYRQCPKCSTSILGNPRKPALTCPNCSYGFCMFHSDAHPGLSCKVYERRNRENEKASRALISETSKRCPGCKMPVEKSGGCNHMCCSRCHTSFCWICGRQVSGDTYPTHYKWWNVFGCPGTQMNDWYGGSWTMFFWRILMFILIFVGPILVIVLFLLLIAIYLACCPLLLPCVVFGDDDTRECILAPISGLCETCGEVCCEDCCDDD